MQNESETEFHRVYKVSPTQQLTKLTHLLRESGEIVVDSWLHVLHFEGINDLVSERTLKLCDFLMESGRL